MRIAYIVHGRFPTEKAHGFQIAQVCDALMDLGHEVTAFTPNFRNDIAAAPQQYYGLRHKLAVTEVAHFDAFQSPVVPGFLGFAVSMRSYGKAVAASLGSQNVDCLYVRSPLLLKAMLRTRIPVILELHSLPRFGHHAFTRSCAKCRLVVCLTNAMRDKLMSWGVPADRVCVEADGVDIRRFVNLPDPASAKWRWKLPADRMVIGYVGSLATRETMEKGVRELLDAMLLLDHRAQEPLLWIVGGPAKWQSVYEEHAESIGLDDQSVRFQGHIDAAGVPSAIAACDVCVYPAPKSNDPYFMRDTSPLKLFEYLAAARPIACADIPPVRDVVSEQTVHFFTPGDASDLGRALQEILRDPAAAKERAARGKRVAEEHGWEKRMQRILDTFASARLH